MALLAKNGKTKKTTRNTASPAEKRKKGGIVLSGETTVAGSTETKPRKVRKDMAT